MLTFLSAGATTAPTLIFILPGLFYIRIVPKTQEPMNSRPKIQVGFPDRVFQEKERWRCCSDFVLCFSRLRASPLWASFSWSWVWHSLELTGRVEKSEILVAIDEPSLNYRHQNGEPPAEDKKKTSARLEDSGFSWTVFVSMLLHSVDCCSYLLPALHPSRVELHADEHAITEDPQPQRNRGFMKAKSGVFQQFSEKGLMRVCAYLEAWKCCSHKSNMVLEV